MSEPCYCGAADCPNCYPGCLDQVVCVSCNSQVYAYQVDRNGICDDCLEEGVGICENCGEAEILVDDHWCLPCLVANSRIEVTK